MSNVRSNFPPPLLEDLERRSAGSFLALSKFATQSGITLFFGSGVSASAGLPIWSTLLTRICSAFFEHWLFDMRMGRRNVSPPRGMSIAFWEQFMWSRGAVALGKEFAQGDPLLVSQQIKNCIRDIDWRYLLNKTLYSIEGGVHRSPTMETLARLCASQCCVSAIVNFNYDSLFEEYLEEVKLAHSIIWSADVRPRPGTLPIYHPHGYLKLGGGPNTDIILSEEDYYRYARVPYAWPDIALIAHLTQSICVFVGCSMTDPNIRRLLRTAHPVSRYAHYAFLPRRASENKREVMLMNLFDRDLETLGVRSIRFPLRAIEGESYSRLPELLALLAESAFDPRAVWKPHPS